MEQIVGLLPKTARNQSRSHEILTHLLQAIVERRLAPGERLPEDALSEAFGVSRTIIRKALHQLAVTKLIELQPNRGAQVASPSEQEAIDVFRARELIEVCLLPLVAANLTETYIKKLNHILDKEHHAHEQGLQYEAISLSAQFHNQLAMVANNQVLSDMVMQLTARSSLVIALYGDARSVGGVCGEHYELIELLKASEIEKAQIWQANHIQKIYASLHFGERMRNSHDFKKIFGVS
jgi:DNA-binding GntR family transcriptional regulator